MPSKKALAILIVCLSIVISIWLVYKKPSTTALISKNAPVFSVSQENTAVDTTNSEWKKLLTTVDTSDSQDLTVKNSVKQQGSFDETTLTAQMAKDLFSRYLLVAKEGGSVDANTASQIASQTLTLPDYTNTKGAVYLASNLHITATNKDNIKKYKDDFVNALGKYLVDTQNLEEPMTLVQRVTSTENYAELSKLDPTIAATRKFMNALLVMNVPSDATNLHLAVLNATSDVLANLDGMRQISSDPIKGLGAIGQYNDHLNSLVTGFSNLDTYFKAKLGANYQKI